jgi:16S rRNA (uracil1498-N3)-methyltransferase
MFMQKFIIQDIQQVPSKGIITNQDARHAYKVLRLRQGDRMEITNGQGRNFSGLITKACPDIIELDIENELSGSNESALNITLCCGMLKDKKMDFIIKHTSQLGIYRWIPFFCERSVPGPDKARLNKRVERWEIIAGESLKQCRRSKVTEIIYPVSFKELMKQSGDYDLKIAFHEKTNEKFSIIEKNCSVKKLIVLIGPEGGFSDSEIHLARENGFLSLSLGPRILRAETAAIVGCALFQHLLGDM